jgi:DNA-binding response OmpR family regulator
MKKILIIDDDIDTITAYSAFFKSKGYLVESAHNTKVGKKLINEFNPELIILDVMMDEPDEGFVFAQHP